MCWASTSVIVAVVQCASSVGGSPRLPTLRTPPFFCAAASGTGPARLRTSNVRTNAAQVEARWLMGHLPVSGELRPRRPSLAHELAQLVVPLVTAPNGTSSNCASSVKRAAILPGSPDDHAGPH